MEKTKKRNGKKNEIDRNHDKVGKAVRDTAIIQDEHPMAPANELDDTTMDLPDSVKSCDEDSSESSSEDEDGVRLPQEFDNEFLKILSSLRNRDPSIYNNQTTFFNDIVIADLKDVHLQKKEKSGEKSTWTEHMSHLCSASDEQSESDKEDRLLSPNKESYIIEQQKIKDSFKEFLDNSDEEDMSELFTIKKLKNVLKTIPSEGHQEQNDKDKPSFSGRYDEDLDEDDKFLRHYVNEKVYLKDNTSKQTCEEQETISDDEKQIKKQEEFEHKYNFRFEEPDPEFIKKYPRLIPNLLRRQDDRRKKKRLKCRERKQKEKIKKRQELGRITAEKRKQIVSKLQEIREITGNDRIGLEDLNLNEEFDSEKHDEQMKKLFAYDNDCDYEKPHFPETDDYEDDAYCDDSISNAESRKTEKHLSKKQRIKLRKLERAQKKKNKSSQLWDQDPAISEEHLDEYYKLHYEDMINDIPCRFKYRKVLPNDFGLTVEEILGSNDTELHSWCPLNNIIAYRTPEEDEKVAKIYRKKCRKRNKATVLKSYYERLQKTRKSRAENEAVCNNKQLDKPTKLQKPKPKYNPRIAISDSRLEAYGINPKRHRNKLIYGNKCNDS